MARFRGRDSHSSGTPVARRLTQPTRTADLETGLGPDRSGPALPLFGLAPGGVYRAASVASCAVGSYPTLSPLPRQDFSIRPGRFAFCGTFPKVTLAGRYPAPCFHGARTFLPRGLSALAAAAVRPTGACGLKWLWSQGQASGHSSPGYVRLACALSRGQSAHLNPDI